MKLILIFFISLFIFSSLSGKEIDGVPKIIDGDTVYINSLKIRFEGIDAP